MSQTPILGAHESIAGGYYKSVEIAARVGCDCVQLFTKNNNQWRAKEITAEDARLFKEALARLKIAHPIAHDSYLINLGAPDEFLWRRSVEAFIVELQRADLLGIPYVITHPGAYTSTSEAAGLKRVIQALNEVHAQTRGLKAQCLLELTAGQGSCLGCTFEHMAVILEGIKNPDLVGICFDTCHVFAAGYPLGTAEDYAATMKKLDKAVGLKKIKAFHLNDSKKELGSRVDRHEHIGLGKLGLEPFRLLLNDKRFRKVPMYLETPKGDNHGEDWDVTNLRVLRSLIDGRTPERPVAAPPAPKTRVKPKRAATKRAKSR